jgi:hypothetical protein
MKMLIRVLCLAVLAFAGCDKSSNTLPRPGSEPLTLAATNSPVTVNANFTNAEKIEAEATASIKLGRTIESRDLGQTHIDGDGECFPVASFRKFGGKPRMHTKDTNREWVRLVKSLLPGL